MSRITPANGAVLPATTSPSPSATEPRSLAVDSYEGPFPPLFDGSAAEKTNWNLYQALQGGAVSGVADVEVTAFYYGQPGLKIEFKLGADVDDVINSIISAYPEFANYENTKTWKTWDFLPKWFPLVERRPVAAFRLDTV